MAKGPGTKKKKARKNRTISDPKMSATQRPTTAARHVKPSTVSMLEYRQIRVRK